MTFEEFTIAHPLWYLMVVEDLVSNPIEYRILHLNVIDTQSPVKYRNVVEISGRQFNGVWELVENGRGTGDPVTFSSVFDANRYIQDNNGIIQFDNFKFKTPHDWDWDVVVVDPT